jgi:hypothetical protein
VRIAWTRCHGHTLAWTPSRRRALVVHRRPSPGLTLEEITAGAWCSTCGGRAAAPQRCRRHYSLQEQEGSGSWIPGFMSLVSTDTRYKVLCANLQQTRRAVFCKLHGTETGEIPNTQSRSNGISWSLQVCTESRFAPDTFSRASYAAVYPRNNILICRNLSPFYHGNNTHPSIDNSIVS